MNYSQMIELLEDLKATHMTLLETKEGTQYRPEIFRLRRWIVALEDELDSVAKEVMAQ